MPRSCVSTLATALFVAILGALTAENALGQVNPRRDTAFAIGELESEHGHFTERFIPPGSGIVVEPVYYGEVFTNTRGGISTRNATRYQGLFDLSIAADFKRLGIPLPGKFVILGQNSHGKGLSADYVGDTQIYSNIDSFENIMQVGEYWWEGSLCDGRLTVRLGKQDVNTEFLVVNSAGDFIQSGFGISPTLAIPTYPHPSAAAVVLADLTESLQLKVGIWDGVPDGRNWGLSGTGITFTVSEIQYDYALCDGKLPGSWDVGIGYLSSGNAYGTRVPQAWGYYGQWEQTITRENPDDDGDDQGLRGFVQYGATYGDASFEFPEYRGVGLVYRGLIPRRDGDMFGVGVARARLNAGGTNSETVTEIFYKIQIRPHLYLQPDMQYIASPSGIHPDALVVGTRVEAAF